MLCRLGLLAAPCVALAVLGVLGSTAHAQPTTRISDVLITQALEEVGVPFTRGPEGCQFKLHDRLTTLKVVSDRQKLLIKTVLTGRDTPLAVLNRYNEEQAITTRAVRYADRGTALEAGFDGRLGATAPVLGKFIASFGRDLRDFEAFLAKHDKPAAEEAVEPKPRPASTSSGVPLALTPGTDNKELVIEFPTAGPAPRETAWKIRWDMKTGQEAAKEGFKVDGREDEPVLFQIKQAFFRPGANAPWLQVLENAHPSEFYVPYFFQHTRFFDLRDVGSYVRLEPRDGGAHSRLLGKEQRVMAELRDRGLAYKHGTAARRAEELVLWANFAAGNYTYLVEFCFHDDGTVAFKHAPTGYNFYDHFESAAHMHNCLWRIGVKLGPVAKAKIHNDVALVKLPYDPLRLGPDGKLDVVPVPTEGGHDFEAKEFTRLRVTNPNFTMFPPSETRPQLPISYELVPQLQGTARHFRHKDEAFSLHDFWVTRSDCPEKMFIKLPEYFQKVKQRSLAKNDGVILWHASSALHVPRGEDGILAGNNLDNGQALVRFTTVELRPRNLFTKTPIYQGER